MVTSTRSLSRLSLHSHQSKSGLTSPVSYALLWRLALFCTPRVHAAALPALAFQLNTLQKREVCSPHTRPHHSRDAPKRAGPYCYMKLTTCNKQHFPC